MYDKLNEIREETLRRLNEAGDEKELEALGVSVLGRSGALTEILRGMGKLEKDERAKFGQTANLVKKELEDAISLRREKIAAAMQEKRFALEALDVTEPGVRKRPMGRLHPMTQTYRTIRDALVGMGFTTFDGPEVEYDEYNFTKLNLPKDHPARDMQDTFYVSERVVLRTHTSPCEARALLALEPPFRLVIPGRVFRVDEADASHSPVFMQMEGLVIDRNISLADLKGTIDAFVHAVFGEEVKTRFRPSYFPFTEPSAEVDISCTMCGGCGCRVCKGTGWLEIMGCGITNPHELENCGLDPREWSAFAFGLGVDRVASLRYGITHNRLQYENDARFLGQF
ncbi:MAG TPA: phenylalanine--tRNA ligase subunit alpha [Clostridia bacterium]|nr:MAG: Phenylalanine--tRNA ligase alpha subunit [Firmicutes bacterium ADurb.Bin248]HOF99462.1 phenylalanine--tRNA ligase subunit alpha [Clostridia bacterium]HOS18728.1 phenylalanine--tRNA ligase subunit alpha [Clostridia bacterium]HPK16451.1 phenylalanine--tRNA ligase subunit alpha [Clostridia bacterium]